MSKKQILEEIDILKDIRNKYGQLFQKDPSGKPTFEVTVQIANYIKVAIDKAVEQRDKEIKLIIASYSPISDKHTKYLLNEINRT